MRFSRKIAPEIKPRQNFITKKRLKEDEINFDKLRSYRLDRVRKELVKNNLEASKLFFTNSFLTLSKRYDLNLSKFISSSFNLFLVIKFCLGFISGAIFLLNLIIPYTTLTMR